MSLINYGSIMNENGEPVMVFELNEAKDAVVLTGPEDGLASYESYFSNPKGGWVRHLEEESPLDSFAANWSHGRNESITDEKKIAEAKKSILKRGGKEVTVSWKETD